MAASEAAPFAKSGGLGDVMQALPMELSRIPGNEVCLFLPYYKKMKENPQYQTELLAEFNVGVGWRKQYCGVHRLKNRRKKLQIFFLDNEYYFNRDGSIYGNLDDGERFAFFSRAVLDALAVLDWTPDVIQCNDWQTAMIPVYLKSMYGFRFGKTKCIFTIHNIEYQGWGNPDFFDNVLGLPEYMRGIMTMGDGINMMKGAIETADAVSTVSETYAQEILYPYYAHGLDGILSGYRYKIFGITNGIDTDVFNPATDEALVKNYDKETFIEGKAANKKAFQEEVGLPQRPDVPLMTMVTRLAGHKGLDLLCYAARRLLQQDVQLVVVGTGEEKYEYFLRCLQADYPSKVSAQIRFDLKLASRAYASADIYLMPSKSEPCGLSQMNAMRYGTVPVVHATGGLKDTVPPADENGAGGLGFTFQSYNADDFYASLKRCLNLYNNNRPAFQALQKRGMETDFSWDVPAARYMDLFRNMLSW